MIRLALACLLLAAVAHAGRVLDRMAAVLVREKGDEQVFQVDLEQRAILVVFLIGPEAATSACAIEVRDAGGKTLDIRNYPPLPAGRYEVVVRAQARLPIAPRLQITAFQAADPYEPNDTREQAARLAPPVRTWILLEYNAQDWFRIDVDEDGVLSVHFTRPLGGSDLWFDFTDAQGRTIWKCKERWDWQGARYFSVEKGKSYFLGVGHGRNRHAWAELELGLYRPQDLQRAGPAAAGRILVVGLDADSADLDQLRLIAKASAKPLTSTVAEDVETMTRELIKDVEEPAAEEPEAAEVPEAPGAAEAPGATEPPGPRTVQPAPDGGSGPWLWILAPLLALVIVVGVLKFRTARGGGTR